MAKKMAKTMIRVADAFPMNFVTERDFYPLIHTYLAERLLNVSSEHAVKAGQIDFRTGGTNPALIELAVAPRAFTDKNRPTLSIPGSSQAPQLHASQNKSELKKLFFTETRYANRYLLLLDLRGDYDFSELEDGYQEWGAKVKKKDGAVCVIYARHDFCDHVRLRQ